MRVVRDKTSGRYLTLSKVFLRHKATRLLSPALEQEACAAATQQNYRPAFHLRLSDGDESLQQLRQRLFPHARWLLDRWHLTQALRAFTGPNQPEFQRLLQPLRHADAHAALAALAQSPLRCLRPKPFQTLSSCLSHLRHGIDAWRHIPAALRHGRGRTPPPVKGGSGAVEKNIGVHINRRFKRQGRSWHPLRAERLLALGQLLAQPQAWTQWWKSKPQFYIQPNPP